MKWVDKLKNYLKQPYWGEYHPIFTIMTVTLLVLFVLVAFRPFGLANNSWKELSLSLLVTTVNMIVGMLILLYVIPALFKSFYAPDNWTIGKNILQNIISINLIGFINGVGHGIFQVVYYDLPPERFLGIFTALFLCTLIVSPLPIVVLTIQNQNRAMASTLRQAQELNQRLMRRGREGKMREELPSLILGSGTKEAITLLPDELLYVEAYGNYVKINYLGEEKLRQKVVRSTIRQIEEALEGYPFIVRCHRAFLVNTHQIKEVDGNSQGYRLALAHTQEEVPVSRAYAKALKEQIG